ncbi:MAG: TldD/PmbA family protein, partial [Dehalococcoidia bacterium]|nr:TldD/PmbA family protein [Dehalococcoidia bacterium]
KAARLAEQAEVFYVESESTPVGFENNRLKHLQSLQTRGLALRIVKEGKIGFASTTDLRNPDSLVEAALDAVPFGPKAHFQLPSPAAYADVELYAPAVEAGPLDRMIELGQALIDGARAHNPDLVCQAGVSKDTILLRILNSNGSEASYRKSIFSLGLQGLLIRDTDMLFVGDGDTYCRPLLDSRPIIERTVRQLELARETAKVSTGEYPVVFTPAGVGNALLTPILVALNGKTVLQGASPLGSRLGQQVFDSQITLVDDATMAYRPGSSPCDEEGIPTRPIHLIEKGVVGQFLYDLQTAGMAGTQSTGSGRRSLDSPPAPSTSTLILQGGKVSFQDMIANMREGLVIEYLMGAGQGNMLAGEFSGNVLLGYKVESGKLVGRVKDAMVSGNVYEALKEGIALGDDGRWVGGSLWAPSLYLPKVAVSAKGTG